MRENQLTLPYHPTYSCLVLHEVDLSLECGDTRLFTLHLALRHRQRVLQLLRTAHNLTGEPLDLALQLLHSLLLDHDLALELLDRVFERLALRVQRGLLVVQRVDGGCEGLDCGLWEGQAIEHVRCDRRWRIFTAKSQ